MNRKENNKVLSICHLLQLLLLTNINSLLYDLTLQINYHFQCMQTSQRVMILIIKIDWSVLKSPLSLLAQQPFPNLIDLEYHEQSWHN